MTTLTSIFEKIWIFDSVYTYAGLLVYNMYGLFAGAFEQSILEQVNPVWHSFNWELKLNPLGHWKNAALSFSQTRYRVQSDGSLKIISNFYFNFELDGLSCRQFTRKNTIIGTHKWWSRNCATQSWCRYANASNTILSGWWTTTCS